MAIKKGRFYFGPAGDLQMLPSLVQNAGVEPTPGLAGNITRSISGSPTVVYYGSRRQWRLPWPMMREQDADARKLHRVEAAYRQALARGYYFLDTRNTNYLQPDVSRCASESNLVDVFRWTTGLPSRTFSGSFHSELDGLIDGYMTFTAATTADAIYARPRLPILAGSSYLFSGFFAGTGQIKLAFQFYDKDAVLISTLIGGAIVLSGTTTGTLQSLNFPSSSVPAGAATFAVGFGAATATIPVVNTNGWMVQYDEAVRPAWMPGLGGAEVVVADYAVRYPTFTQREIVATFLEV